MRAKIARTMHVFLGSSMNTSGPSDTDSAAWASWEQAQTSAGLEQLIKPHLADCQRVARRIAGPDLADDVLQVVMVKLLTGAASWSATGSFRAWLLAVVAHSARHQVRGELRRRRYEAKWEAPAPTQALDADTRRLVTDSLNALEDTYRLPILLHIVDGLPHAEVGAVLQRKEATVRQQTRRGLNRLGELLRARGITTSTASLIALLNGDRLAAASPALTVTSAQMVGGSISTSSWAALSLAAVVSVTSIGMTAEPVAAPEVVKEVFTEPVADPEPEAVTQATWSQALDTQLSYRCYRLTPSEAVEEIKELLTKQSSTMPPLLALPIASVRSHPYGIVIEHNGSLRDLLQTVSTQSGWRWRSCEAGIVLDKALPAAESQALWHNWQTADADSKQAAGMAILRAGDWDLLNRLADLACSGDAAAAVPALKVLLGSYLVSNNPYLGLMNRSISDSTERPEALLKTATRARYVVQRWPQATDPIEQQGLLALMGIWKLRDTAPLTRALITGQDDALAQQAMRSLAIMGSPDDHALFQAQINNPKRLYEAVSALAVSNQALSTSTIRSLRQSLRSTLPRRTEQAIHRLLVQCAPAVGLQLVRQKIPQKIKRDGMSNPLSQALAPLDAGGEEAVTLFAQSLDRMFSTRRGFFDPADRLIARLGRMDTERAAPYAWRYITAKNENPTGCYTVLSHCHDAAWQQRFSQVIAADPTTVVMANLMRVVAKWPPETAMQFLLAHESHARSGPALNFKAWADALAQVRHPQAAAHIAALATQETHPQRRASALIAQIQSRDPQAWPRVLRTLDQEQEATVVKVAAAIALRSEDSAYSAITAIRAGLPRWFGDREAEVRREIARTLAIYANKRAYLIPPPSEAFQLAARELIATAVRKDTDAEMRALCAHLLMNRQDWKDHYRSQAAEWLKTEDDTRVRFSLAKELEVAEAGKYSRMHHPNYVRQNDMHRDFPSAGKALAEQLLKKLKTGQSLQVRIRREGALLEAWHIATIFRDDPTLLQRFASRLATLAEQANSGWHRVAAANALLNLESLDPPPFALTSYRQGLEALAKQDPDPRVRKLLHDIIKQEPAQRRQSFQWPKGNTIPPKRPAPKQPAPQEVEANDF